MKRIIVLLAFALLLTGCSESADFETMQDVYGEQQLPAMRQVQYQLPQDASAQAIQSSHGQLYFCDGYDIALQTFSAGNLDSTLRELTGFGKDSLTLIETAIPEGTRYECVWSAAGEEGNMVCRAAILDDGNYHYCMTVMAHESDVLRLSDGWQALFDSFILG